jgi:hypothetical protein
MWNLLPGSSSRSSRAASVGGNTAIVRLIDSPRRSPATQIEQQLMSALKRVGPVSSANLVKTVAADLYAAELRKGAAVLDIGLFGGRLFTRDIIRELHAGDGILWDIKPEKEPA